MMCLKKQHSKRYTQEQLDTLTASGIHIDTRRRYFLIIHVFDSNYKIKLKNHYTTQAV